MGKWQSGDCDRVLSGRGLRSSTGSSPVLPVVSDWRKAFCETKLLPVYAAGARQDVQALGRRKGVSSNLTCGLRDVAPHAQWPCRRIVGVLSRVRFSGGACTKMLLWRNPGSAAALYAVGSGFESLEKPHSRVVQRKDAFPTRRMLAGSNPAPAICCARITQRQSAIST